MVSEEHGSEPQPGFSPAIAQLPLLWNGLHSACTSEVSRRCYGNSGGTEKCPSAFLSVLTLKAPHYSQVGFALSLAPQRVLASPASDGNEQKFIDTRFGEDGWVNSWGFSKDNYGEEPAPGQVGAGARPQTLSQAQLLLLFLLLAHHIQVPVLPHALAQLDGARAHILPCGNGGFQVRFRPDAHHTHCP